MQRVKSIIDKYKFVLLIAVGLLTLICGRICSNFNIMLCGILIILVNNIFYGIIERKRIYFLFFNITIFVFLLSRPTISMFRGNEWWTASEESVYFSLYSIVISLIFLFLGSIIYEKINQSKSKNIKVDNKQDKYFFKNNRTIVNITMIMLLITYASKMFVEINKLIFMYGKDYAEYYILYKPNVPSIISFMSGMLYVTLCMYLLTNPPKKKSFIVLTMYITTTIPMFLIGERGSIVNAIIFSFLYFVYRNITDKKEVWIGKIEKITIAISIPVFIIGLGAYNYIREDKKVPTFNPLELSVDFLYKQGVSYDVLCIGKNVMNQLPNKESKNYTFGGFIDYFRYNAVSRKIFNIKDLGTGNSERKAIESNSFSHAMSYIAKKDYLQGHGWGSSYLLEVYADYGYIGIIIYSILMGMFLRAIIDILDKNNIISLITLCSTTKIFMAPRAEATGFLQFIFEFHFLVPVIILICLNKICDINTKKKMNKEEDKTIENKKSI